MNLEQFKQLNKEVGNHWFSPDTMRFFKSKVCTWDCVTGYFITSETDPSGIKAYSIRKANFDTGRVETVGEFHKIETLHKAKKKLVEICPTCDTRSK